MKTATIIGATGLIGSHLLDLLLKDSTYSQVRVLVRRPMERQHPNLEVRQIDFTDDEAFKSAIKGSDVVFCAVGTTNKNVKGDLTAYRKVDYDIPVRAAQFCAESGVQHFILVSAAGTDSKSRNFYARLKGEVEEAVLESGVSVISIMRPSMLLGKREEFRLGELIGKTLMRVFSFVIPSVYKPIEAGDVAKAMIAQSKKTISSGKEILFYKEMQQLCR
jgi:uncharacterized protein YbjT (DUF2867 family)